MSWPFQRIPKKHRLKKRRKLTQKDIQEAIVQRCRKDFKEEQIRSEEREKTLKPFVTPPKKEVWEWPLLRTNSGGDIEFMCPHGVGHGGTHGCDGCCKELDYEKRLEELKRKPTGE